MLGEHNAANEPVVRVIAVHIELASIVIGLMYSSVFIVLEVSRYRMYDARKCQNVKMKLFRKTYDDFA